MSLWGKEIVPCSTFHTFARLSSKPDKKFMAMFMGFMDGDGYFDLGEQKQYNKNKILAKSTIRIRLATNVNVRDLTLLEYFVKTLGAGKIDYSMMARKEQVRVIFSKKDLFTVIIPLIKEYDLMFLTSQRAKQFARVNYILENSIIHWDEFKFKEPMFVAKSVQDLVKLNYYADWLVGFTMAEGSFGIKADGSAFYQLKQSGNENVNILKAASLLITAEESKRIFNPDSKGAYQLSLTSIKNIEQVIYFFSSPDYHPLYSYKLDQYLNFISALKTSKRYSSIAAKFNK